MYHTHQGLLPKLLLAWALLCCLKVHAETGVGVGVSQYLELLSKPK